MAIQTSCGALLKQIHDELEKQINNSLRPSGLTVAQLSVLLALRDVENGQMSLKELEKFFHVAQSTAAGIVARLEQKHLVEGLGDAQDRRVKMVRITEAGLCCCHHADKDMEETELRILSGLTETERLILQELLKKVRDSLI